MSMVKHGNTFFGGDKVITKIAARGTNSVAPKVGKVAVASSLDGQLRIDWEDGTVTHEFPQDLQSAG